MTDWCSEPLIPGDWKELDHSEAVDFAYLLGTDVSFPGGEISGDLQGIRALPLSCFPEALLLEGQFHLTDVGQPVLANFILGPNGLVVIDGNSAAIHSMRTNLSLETEEQARTYVSLFCSAVHGFEGRFRIIGSEADILVHGAHELKASVREAIAEGLVVSLLDDGEGWNARAALQYDDRLFVATFHLKMDGTISMESDEQPDEELRLVPERWQECFRFVLSAEPEAGGEEE